MISNLQTEDLILRPLKFSDTPRFPELAGDTAVAETSLDTPHPYPLEAAENWIRNHPKLIDNGNVFLIDNEELIGTITIRDFIGLS